MSLIAVSQLLCSWVHSIFRRVPLPSQNSLVDGGTVQGIVVDDGGTALLFFFDPLSAPFVADAHG